ncbi:MAG TPA: DUF4019 domain-containing protein [Verrucomicrobiae bacterium]|nr:DUF4019 domain-containing protein [Verrucomicrobiae bacterium]
MNRTLTIIAAVALTSAAAQAQQSPADKATAAAEAWLKIVDEGAYPDAYTKISEKWRKGTRENVFSQLLTIHHRNRGDFKSRSLLSAEKVPGEIVIDGKKANMMSVRFATEWSESKATETVNVIEDDDDVWRVVNYGVQGARGQPSGPKSDEGKKDEGKKDKKGKAK